MESVPRSFITDFELPVPTKDLKAMDRAVSDMAVLRKTGVKLQEIERSNTVAFDVASPNQEDKLAELLAEQERNRQWELMLADKKAAEKEERVKKQRQQWKKQLKVISFENDPDYYKSLPISPGFGFFKNLVKAKRVPVSHLDLRIPDTMFVEDNMLWIRYLPGKLDVQKEFQASDYYRNMEALTIDSQRAAVIRVPAEGFSSMTCVPLNWTDFSSKILRS